ncbi:hypothetical protein R6Q57_002350 [Mikania cordata]
MSSRKRKSERIVSNLSRFTNIEEDPIDLDTTDKSKQVSKKNMKQKVPESDTDMDEERIHVKMREKGIALTKGEKTCLHCLYTVCSLHYVYTGVTLSSRNGSVFIDGSDDLVEKDIYKEERQRRKVLSGKEKMAAMAKENPKTSKEVLDESVCLWRRQYEGRFLATRQIVEKIESVEDENTFDFKMDFLVLFMAILVECHKNGRVREGILRYITSETDFSEIDWCTYIFENLRSCKIRWSRDDNSSPFNGPLTILTMCIFFTKCSYTQTHVVIFKITSIYLQLIYVEGFECKGISVDKRIEPIEFWNKNRLKIKEDWEIKHGGFGRGNVMADFVEEGLSGNGLESDEKTVEARCFFNYQIRE